MTQFVRRSFRSIEPTGEAEVRCIAVEAEDQLYVTKDYIVTHNTKVAARVAQGIGARTVLVIAPQQTEDGWRKHFPDTEVQRIDSTKKGMAAYASLAQGEPGVYWITHQMFALGGSSKAPNKDGKGGRVQKFFWGRVSKHIDLAALDESHIASNRKSQTFEVLKTLKPKFKLCLSATPTGNRFEGIWAPCRWLWRDYPDIVIPYFNPWVARWCTTEHNQYADITDSNGKVVSRGTRVTGEREPGAFVATLPCYISLVVEKKPVDTKIVDIPLNPEQERIWKELEKHALAWVGDHPLAADLPIVLKTRMRQVALATPRVTFTGETDEDGVPLFEVDFADDCESAKIDACHKIVAREAGKQIIFFTDSAKFANVLAKRLGPDAAAWTGVQSKNERQETKERFLAGQVRYLVATIAAIGTGTDGLQRVCSTEVWLNESFNGVHNQQATGRLNRTGQDADRITRYRLHARPSDDAETYTSLMEASARLNASLNKEDV